MPKKEKSFCNKRFERIVACCTIFEIFVDCGTIFEIIVDYGTICTICNIAQHMTDMVHHVAEGRVMHVSLFVFDLYLYFVFEFHFI